MARYEVMALESARWKLAMLWFPVCGLLLLLLVVQSLAGAYQENLQNVWGWALPNFLPTISVMISVFAGDALLHDERPTYVRKNFCNLAFYLSVFYLLLVFISILAPPLVNYFNGPDANVDKLQIMQSSNLWLGPVQGLVVVSLGVLFFLKEDKENNGDV